MRGHVFGDLPSVATERKNQGVLGQWVDVQTVVWHLRFQDKVKGGGGTGRADGTAGLTGHTPTEYLLINQPTLNYFKLFCQNSSSHQAGRQMPRFLSQQQTFPLFSLLATWQGEGRRSVRPLAFAEGRAGCTAARSTVVSQVYRALLYCPVRLLL